MAERKKVINPVIGPDMRRRRVFAAEDIFTNLIPFRVLGGYAIEFKDIEIRGHAVYATHPYAGHVYFARCHFQHGLTFHVAPAKGVYFDECTAPRMYIVDAGTDVQPADISLTRCSVLELDCHLENIGKLSCCESIFQRLSLGFKGPMRTLSLQRSFARKLEIRDEDAVKPDVPFRQVQLEHFQTDLVVTTSRVWGSVFRNACPMTPVCFNEMEGI